jgi:hypothetical protein
MLIRFPFNKKTISALQEVLRVCNVNYHHNKGTHKHAIKLTERTAYEVYNAFKEKSFSIDNEIKDIAMSSSKLVHNEQKYLPGFQKQKFVNLHENCKETIEQELSIYDNLLIDDRRYRYGLNHVEHRESPNELTNKIVNRDAPLTQVDTNKYTVPDLLSSILELERFPVLVVIDHHKSFDQLNTFFNASKYIVDPSKQICLFRVDNTTEYNLNDFIKDNNFNNYLDTNIEIVYISSNNLPKLLLKTDWKPLCVVSHTGSIVNNNVLTYCKDISDLIILYDSFIAATRSRWSSYGNL